MQKQIEATKGLDKELAKMTDDLLSSAQASAKEAQSTALLNKGFDSLTDSLHRQSDALIEQAEANRDANLELIAENENIGPLSSSLLELMAIEQAEIEMRKIRIQTAQSEARLLVERNRASEDFAEEEEERLQKLIKAYDDQLQGVDEWHKKFVDAQKDAREQAVDTAYEEARSASEFEKAYEMRIALLTAQQEEASKALEKEKEDKIKAQKEVSDATIKEYEKEQKDKLRVQEDFVTAERNRAKVAFEDALGDARLNLKQQKADQQIAFEKRIKDAQKNNENLTDIIKWNTQRQNEINIEFTMATSVAREELAKEEVKIAEDNAKLIEQINAEHNAKVSAEDARFTEWSRALSDKYITEETQLLSYYTLQMENADETKKELWAKEIARQEKVIAKWLEMTAINEAYLEMLDKQVQATEEARIADMLAIGDLQGATDAYVALSKKKEEADKQALEQKYLTTKAEMEGGRNLEKRQKSNVQHGLKSCRMIMKQEMPQ